MADVFFGGVSNQADAADMPSSGEAGKYRYEISFRGDGQTLFKIWITNLLLTICTLGIYYPWGRARTRRYIYSSTYFGDHNFEFHGTGKQMFFGLVKLLFINFFAGMLVFLFIKGMSWMGGAADVLDYLLSFIVSSVILALFIHGSRNFRMAKTTYRGIRFGYWGDKQSLIMLMLKGYALTIVTLGIYYPWFLNNIRKYIYCNTSFGSGEVKFNFNGKGGDYFRILLAGWFLTVITFGVYYFWYKKNTFNFFYQNMSFGKEDGKTVEVFSRATGKKFFKLIAINMLIVVFTMGLGSPFAKVRTLRFIADNLELSGNLDLDGVMQTAKTYSDATGDEADDADFFDLDLF